MKIHPFGMKDMYCEQSSACTRRQPALDITKGKPTSCIVLLLVAASLFGLLCPLAHAGLNSGPEYDKLLEIYNSTNGPMWTNSTNWGAGDACSWHGIACDQDGTPSDNTSHVTSMDLDTNNLTGYLPALTALSNLQYFDLRLNHLTGPIPCLSTDNPCFSGLTALQTFDLQYNQLSGSIPVLEGLTDLQYFNVQSNELTGPIPALTGLTNLKYFDVQFNQLTGSIPDLAGLTHLVFFAVTNNQLTGPVPGLTGLADLQIFGVGANQLTGTIPALTGLTSLKYFYVDNNKLTGAVPTAPASLILAILCPNPLDTTPSANDVAWDSATGFTPWWASPHSSNNCDDVFTSGFDG
jgi:hypothetical protein